MSAAYSAALAPDWVEQFRDSPAEALDDLLLGRAWLGTLSGADPAEALLDLGRAMDADASFKAGLDQAICDWLSANFEKPPSCHTGRWANAFCAAFRAVEELELRSAARLLRRDIEAWRSYLRGFYDGPSQDPESACLRALAANQEDRELLGLWYSVCRLQPSLPTHFGLVGVLGLRWLPGEKGDSPPDINPEVSRGLLLLGTALRPFGAEREAEFKRVLRLTRAAYPRSPQTWADLLNWEQEEDSEDQREVDSCVIEAFPDIVRARLKQHFEKARPKRAAVFHVSRWRVRAERIAAELSSSSWASALREAEDLLSEQLSYARATGDAGYLVKSACNFSRHILGKDNDRALRWTGDALRWEPYNPYTHTQHAACLKEIGRLPEAEAILWEAVRRFPGNVVAHTGLAEVLKAQRRLVEAEAEYSEARSRFADNAYCWVGLAGVLSAQGRFEEAEAELRDAKRRFPTNEAVRNALAEFLYAKRRPGEAEAEYRETLARPSPERAEGAGPPGERESLDKPGVPSQAEAQTQVAASSVARCGLGHLLRRMARHDARNGRAEQAAERRSEAHALFQSVLQERPADSYALAGEGFLLLDEGRPREAVALFEDASRRYPGLGVFAYGLMRARRESGQCLPEPAWEGLASRTQRVPSVFRLEHARASLAAGNLATAQEQVRDLFEEFMGARQPRRSRDGNVSTAEWYLQSLGRLLFLDAPQGALAAGPDIEEVVRRLPVVSTEVDEISEECAMAA